MEWLIGGARQTGSFARTIDELSWRLVAAGIPLLRVNLRGGTLHPQFLGAVYVWWRSSAQTREIMITHEVADLVPPAQNPVMRVAAGEILRRSLEGPEARFDFSVLHDLKAGGATDYFALPVGGAFGPRAYMAAYVTDRPGGFLEREIADLSAVSERLSIIADMNSQRQIAENVLKAYLGPQTGRKVLAGQIRRGSGEAIAAVLWSSDLRRFTQLSDQLPGERVIGILNDLFDLQAKAITGHGGEILKFIGDGLLAIFPVAGPEEAARIAANALAAAQQAQAALGVLHASASAAGEPPLEIVIALHYGTVIYGNIGAADRLDFTVIGPAVNLVSRIEAIAKSLDLPLIVSDDFAHAYGGTLQSLGLHQLRGLDQAHELFTPPLVG
jgi:adenylate cyclase